MCKGTVAAPCPCDVSIPDFSQKVISFLVKNMLITERKFFVIRSQEDFFAQRAVFSRAVFPALRRVLCRPGHSGRHSRG